MSRNGSGTMAIPNTFVARTTAKSADVNENFSDIGDEITNSVAADGQTSMTGALKAFAGTEALPGLSFATDTDTGIRRSAANTLAMVCNANDVVTVEETEVTLNTDVALTAHSASFDDAVDFAAAVDVASAATADIGAAASNTVNMTGTETITSLGTAAAGVERWCKFNGATLTHNATSLILPGGQNITTAAGDTALFKSEGSGNWRCYDYERASALPLFTPVLPGYRNLTVQVTSATAISVSADSAILTDSVGRAKLFSSVSETLAITTAGAGGLDTGSEAVSTWYAVFLIAKEDGTIDALLSTSTTSPTLPTGYTYFVRVGMVRNDSSGDFLRTLKRNDWVQYVVGTNPSAVVSIMSGTVSAGTEIDLSSYVPPSGIEVDVAVTRTTTAGSAALAPNSGTATVSESAPLFTNTPNNAPIGPERGRLILETAQKVYGYCTGNGIGLLFSYRDNV